MQNGGRPVSKTNMCVPGHLMSTKVESHWPSIKHGCIDKETEARGGGDLVTVTEQVKSI